MACSACSQKNKTVQNLVFAKTATVTPSNCPEPDYLKELEKILLCMSLNKYFKNSSSQEVNMLLGQIGTMRISSNYCQFDLASFYNRLKHIQCPDANTV